MSHIIIPFDLLFGERAEFVIDDTDFPIELIPKSQANQNCDYREKKGRVPNKDFNIPVSEIYHELKLIRYLNPCIYFKIIFDFCYSVQYKSIYGKYPKENEIKNCNK